ncbi:MAG: hypothetical protein PF636_08870 [Actinomycetota bacterium]|jgi:hypothetical protein|nr:hypothetical protein [Actinomycetota bacterium]
MRLIVIDPGLANTAVLTVDDGRITSSQTWTTKAHGPKPTFAEVMERGNLLADRLFELLTMPENREATVVIEAYEDFGGGHLRIRKGKPIPNRWTTPVICALLGNTAETCLNDVVWQLASLVMTHYAGYKQMWAAGQKGIIPGDELVTNDHERSAACHAIAYINTHRYEKGQS